MSETENLGHLPPSRLPIVLLHSAQLLLAIIILGLDAYGIRYVAHDVLIYSLVTVSAAKVDTSHLVTYRSRSFALS